jgi:LCP family protein required for cell wall assembly
VKNRLRYGLGIGAAVVIGIIVLFVVLSSGGDEEPEAAPTTKPPPAASTLPPTTLPPGPEVSFDGTEPEAETLVADLYAWLFGPDVAEPAGLPPDLAAHLAGASSPVSLEVDAGTTSAELQFGQKVAVITADDDVVLLADEADGAGWHIVGAKLPRFGLEAWYGSPTRTVLIVGSDARWQEDALGARSDSLHIVTAVPGENAGSIVGIPRDSWVANPNGRNQKITDILALFGPEGTLETVRRISGAPIEGYILTGFLGFELLSADFGPFEIDLPQAIRGGLSGFPDFPEGPQTIEPTENLLLLARIRKTLANGDFDRSRNHGIIMKAALAEVERRGITELPLLLKYLTDATWTDLSAGDLLTLGAAAYELDNDQVNNVVIPGGVGTAGGGSVVFIGDGADEVFADVSDDGMVSPQE